MEVSSSVYLENIIAKSNQAGIIYSITSRFDLHSSNFHNNSLANNQAIIVIAYSAKLPQITIKNTNIFENQIKENGIIIDYSIVAMNNLSLFDNHYQNNSVGTLIYESFLSITNSNFYQLKFKYYF